MQTCVSCLYQAWTETPSQNAELECTHKDVSWRLTSATIREAQSNTYEENGVIIAGGMDDPSVTH